jgi:hypothetical protein
MVRDSRSFLFYDKSNESIAVLAPTRSFLVFHQINYHQYQAMWDHICLWSDRYKYYYCIINFSSHFRSNNNPEAAWLETWWKKFGLNPSAIHPDVLNVEQMFHHLNLSDNVHRLNQISRIGYMTNFINENHPWVI